MNSVQTGQSRSKEVEVIDAKVKAIVDKDEKRSDECLTVASSQHGQTMSLNRQDSTSELDDVKKGPTELNADSCKEETKSCLQVHQGALTRLSDGASDSYSFEIFQDNSQWIQHFFKLAPLIGQAKKNTYRYLFHNVKQEREKHGIVIAGHRGGRKNTQPENTMRAFKEAVELGIQQIELDVWLTTDDKLVIMHGGDNGELPPQIGKEDAPVSYIFDQSYDSLKEYVSATLQFKNTPQDEDSNVCELKHVLDHILSKNDKEIISTLNIELKVPDIFKLKQRYRWMKAVEDVHELVQKRVFAEYCIVSSFDTDALAYMENINRQLLVRTRNVRHFVNTLYIQNYYHDWPLIPIEEVNGSGINAQIHWLTKEIVDDYHSKGKIVSIWVDPTAPNDAYEDNEELYQRAYDLGVDMITTDYPEFVEEVLKQYHSEKHLYIEQPPKYSKKVV